MGVEQPRKGKLQGPRKIKWFRLKDSELSRQFKARVLEEIVHEIEDVDEWRNRTAEMILRNGKEILEESSGKIFENKETWWFNQEVQPAQNKRKKQRKGGKKHNWKKIG